MNTSSINYIIATYPGKTPTRLLDANSEGILHLHLTELYKTLSQYGTTNVQITIVSGSNINHELYLEYYKNIDDWIVKFKDIDINLVLIDFYNKYMSYDQWIYAYTKYPEFDYYLLIEDDYVLNGDINELVDLYKSKFVNNIGYLCGLILNEPKMYNYTVASISNGLISKETFSELPSNMLEYFHSMSDNMFVDKRGQLKFSYIFKANNIKILDYCDTYSSYFWVSPSQRYEKYSIVIDKHIILPIQYFYNNDYNKLN